MSMDVTLKVFSSGLAAEDLQDLTRGLCNTINKETELIATLPGESGKAGMKGAPIELGQILLTALTSGTIVALFNVLKSYFERKPSLEIEFERTDGKKFKIQAEQLDKTRIEDSFKLANKFLQG